MLKNTENKRFWEVDFLRGIAVVLMIFFNYAFTLRYFGIYTIEGGWNFWWLFPRIIAGTFILLMGLSLSLSYYRSKDAQFKKYLLRGLKIFGYGLAITLVTWLYMREGFVVFGILHFIGLSTIMAYPLLKHARLSLLLGAVFIFAGYLLSGQTFDFPWLVWLGLVPAGFYSIDYFPLLPWFGVTLFGVAAGNLFYPKGKRAFKIASADSAPVKLFSFFGRHSLTIYLAHQPVLLVALYLLRLL